MTVTIKSALARAREQLRASGGASAALDAEVLLAHVTGLDRAGLYCRWERHLTSDEEADYGRLVSRRAAGEPVAYLTGHKEFMSLSLAVNNSVLIPRPETEILVETALKLLPDDPVIVDVGTGSGAIAVSLARLMARARVYALDYSRKALEIARVNAARHEVGERITFLQGDLLEPLALCLPEPVGAVDLVAANLPYIPENDLSGLPREVRLFEPVMALDGGQDGLSLYRRLIPVAGRYLKNNGYLIIEIGCLQGPAALSLFGRDRWEAGIIKDLAGKDRFIAARFKGSC